MHEAFKGTRSRIHLSTRPSSSINKLGKGPYCNTGGFPDSAFDTISRDVHRKRRGAVATFFIRSHIESQMPMSQQKALSLCEKLEAFAAS